MIPDHAAGETLERDLIFVGTVGMIDPPREEAVAVREARRAGIRVVMITGDYQKTAARIAADLGFVDAGSPALTGTEIDAVDEAAFADAMRETSDYARVAPTHKLRIVVALQADANIVAMTGDDVSDAPALKAADIGIVMGVTRAEVTKEAAKMILADDKVSTLVQAVHEGRAILDNIRKFLCYLRHPTAVDQPHHQLRPRTGDLTTARTTGSTVLMFTSLFACVTVRSDTTCAFANLFCQPLALGCRRTLAAAAAGGLITHPHEVPMCADEQTQGGTLD